MRQTMYYKFYVFCPDDEIVIADVINAATKAGAGIIGNYTHCAFIQKGRGNWKAGKGSNPAIGKVGKMTRIDEVKIEMECPAEKAKAVEKAIKEVHPYEEVVIDFVRLEEI